MKIKLELEKEDMEFLSDMLDSVALSDEDQKIKAEAIKKELKKILNDSILQDVKNALGKFQNIEPNLIKESHSLKFDLGIGDSRKKELAVPFTLIANKYKEGATVDRKECVNLDKVSECVTLIKSKV